MKSCKTCKHYIAWEHAFDWRANGVCTAPLPQIVPEGNRAVSHAQGDKCQTWQARKEENK